MSTRRMSGLGIQTESLGGSALARAVLEGRTPAGWYVARPTDASSWRDRAEAVRTGFSGGAWLTALDAAIAAGGIAHARLARVRDGQGVLVTTGQQPGLFGGPLYTWLKALGALALADEIERATGIPAAPLFWAATDDADFGEASWTAIAIPGGSERLALDAQGPLGRPMADMPLGEVGAQLERLRASAGPVIDPRALDAVRESYDAGATVGSAYVTLLRRLLEPLGIPVLDASHRAVSDATRPLLLRALDMAEPVSEALRAREAEVAEHGFEVQVRDVAGLSLVFDRTAESKVRVPLTRARAAAGGAIGGVLAPNVLLRPIVERALMPTVASLAGPGEIAYFAQVGAVARALGAAVPLVVPRWSCTVVEPHVQRILGDFSIGVHDLADPHAMERRVAMRAVPPASARALRDLQVELEVRLSQARLAMAQDDGLLTPAIVDGVGNGLRFRLARLERRLLAAVKRRESEDMQRLATARGALFPLGRRQERALNAIPLFARHGPVVIERLLAGARGHARALVRGGRAEDVTAGVGAPIAALDGESR